MKKLLHILILTLGYTTIVNAQSVPILNPRQQEVSSLFDQENFRVHFSVSSFGIEFKLNDPVLDDKLKEKIRNFMKKNASIRPKYDRMGKFTLHIIKKNDHYYVVEREKPRELIPL